MKKSIRTVGYSLAALIFILLLGFSLWSAFPAGPGDTALSALISDSQVQVTEMPGWIIFTPIGTEPESGLIFYPGGNVDYRSYAPVLWKIAQAGYQVVVPDMPFNLAVFAPDKASSIMEAYPQITHWAIGGHSLGGAMAARYAFQNSEKVSGLLLWAAYPASSDDLSTSNLLVTSIYATNDGLATRVKIDASRPLLPDSTTWVEIVGGNHAQFGDYGIQKGDNGATISAAKQWEQIINATLELMDRITP